MGMGAEVRDQGDRGQEKIKENGERMDRVKVRD